MIGTDAERERVEEVHAISMIIYIYIYIYIYRERERERGIHGVMAIIGIGHSNQNSNLDEAVCTSHRTNTLGKSMNPTILPPTIGK